MLKSIILMILVTNQLNAEDLSKSDTISDQLQHGLNQLAPTAQIKSHQSTPLKGISEIIIGNDDIGGKVYYMSDDGEYLIQGTMIETKSRINLTEIKENGLRKETVDQFSKAQRINFYPEKMKHKVTVFTDIDCGYCRKLHNQMTEYNELGIGISYLMFPRSGLKSRSYDKAVTVWCSDDKNNVMDNGTLIPTYMPPKALLQRLQQIESSQKQ